VDAEDVGNYLTARVFTSQGRPVATLAENHRDNREVVLYWNGRDEQNRGVAPGVYMVKLRSNSAAGLVKAVIVR
jgi:hypothetical protein